jgi:molybdopterin converting factor small subunit
MNIMKIRFRILGALREVVGLKELSIDVPNNATVGSAIKQLIGYESLTHSVLWDQEVDSPIPNALILLDGVEINNLKGIETSLEPEQEIVILSIIHGG